MASSKVMPSSTSTNSDLGRQNSTYSAAIGDLQGDQSKNYGSMSMDDLMRNMYGDNPPAEMIGVAASGDAALASFPKEVGNRTVEEVWKDISGSNGGGGDVVEQKMAEVRERTLNEMTLEEFLTKARAVTEEDVKIPQIVGPVTGFVVDQGMEGRFQQQQGEAGSGSGSIVWLGNGGGEKVGGGRGKRRAVMEPIDKVAQQRQRRMIKNRESAARSRERKQAYTVELESLVTQLEEENSQLRREKVEHNRERYNQLMEKRVPAEEWKRPDKPHFGVLRRSKSSQW